ncbi:MAG: winged helix-turn-helix transcriptional regulator [Myxococcaceae bacterium]|nr:winged helix-turn-helix transcriptional regulator [Myxococcaceae bacterium]
MDAFVAIADPTRRQVMELLRSGDRTAGELVAAFPRLSQPAMSKHLRVLREAGLVNVRPKEQRRIYSLRPEGLAELDRWISQYRSHWQSRLEALERHLERRAASRLQPKSPHIRTRKKR